MPCTIFPDTVDEMQTKSMAEIKLHGAFKRDLGYEYIVIHSVRWTQQGVKRIVNPDPEIDFLIMRPGMIILCLEVKGGLVGISGKRWLQNGEPMTTDPLDQALANKHGLINFIKTRKDYKGEWIPIDACLAFPDTLVNPARHIADELVLTSRHLDDVGAWVERAMRYSRARQTECSPLTPNLAAMITGLFAEGRKTRPVDVFAAEEREFAKLTEKQLRLLSSWRNQRRAVAAGCAGSGKTFLAIEKAKRLSSANLKVLVTCQTPELVGFLRDQLKDFQTVHVDTFMGICLSLASQAAYSLPRFVQSADLDEDFRDFVLPESISRCIRILAQNGQEPRFDAIIVDEGQAFRELWWEALDDLLIQGEKGIRYIFFDNNQRIFGERDRIPGEDECFILDENCRNTQQIHWATVQFYQSDTIPGCNNVAGVPIEAYGYTGSKDMVSRLARVLHKIVTEGGVPTNDVIVLTPRPREASLFGRHPNLKLGKFRVAVGESADPCSVRYESIRSFRGLERRVVILVEIDEDCVDYPELLYIGMSRPRNQLIVLYSVSLSDEVKEQILISVSQDYTRHSETHGHHK